MKNIIDIHERDFIPSSQVLDTSAYNEREAARAVVVDASGRVALLYVGKHKYHKLPGGGVEEGEDIENALERELLEEIGCKAKVTDEIGQVIEYRDKWQLKQTSYCFLAQQVGEKGNPDFTEKELDEQFSIL